MLSKLAFNYISPWYEVVRWARKNEVRIWRDEPTELFGELADQKEMVVLDDIGGAYETDFSKTTLLEFLDRRQHKWMMITSNLTLEEIGRKLDVRIASRMLRHGSVVVEMNAIDFNLR